MRIISPSELGPLKGITFTNVWRLELERQGNFPKRVKLGLRRYGYLERELDQWLEQRAAGRELPSQTTNPDGLNKGVQSRQRHEVKGRKVNS
jgi:predicted DNA-binding transcriptional regulator AlpA